MVIKKTGLAVVLITIGGFLNAQEFYVKPALQYHFSVAKQQAPQYFIIDPGFPLYSSIEKFSVPQGLAYGCTFGRKFNQLIGVELSINYFRSNSTFADKNFPEFVKWNWDFRTFNSTPSVVLTRNFGKASLSSKFGVIIALAKLEKGVYVNGWAGETWTGYNLKDRLSFGYSFGLEFRYPLSSLLSFSVSCGMDNQWYTPEKAELIEASYNYKTAPMSVREIEYKRSISNVPVYNYNQQFYGDRNSPSSRLSETLKLSSIYVGTGLICKISGNEND